jgi:hypothetical protein
MVKVARDLIVKPIVETTRLWDTELILDTSSTPYQLNGIYEPNYNIYIKIPADGNLYYSPDDTSGYFSSPIAPTPSGNLAIFSFTVMKNALVGIWYGRTSANYDTPVHVAINKQIRAMLVTNLSSNTVVVIHNTTYYSNYETTGTYNSGNQTVTLSQGQYVLFYNTTKPTVNTSAPIGFTNYEPIASTSQPSGNWIKVVYGSTTYWLTNTVKYNLLCTVGNSDSTVKQMYQNDYYGLGFAYWYYFRSGYRADTCQPHEAYVARIFNLYSDDVNATSWAESVNIAKIVYIEDSEGILKILRLIKTTTTPYYLKYTAIQGEKFIDGTKKRIKLLMFDKAYTNCSSFGEANLVRHPAVANLLSSANASYWNGTQWVSVQNPSNSSYEYHDGYYIGRATGTLPFSGTSFGGIICVRRWGGYHTGNYPVVVFVSGYGSITLFINYDGSTITAGNAVWGIGEAVIDPSGNLPTLTDISPYESPVSEDSERWSLRYGYPYTISVNAPTSAQAGSTVNVQVTTNAPNGKYVYVVDKDTDEILGSATVSSGSATVSFTMPNKNLNIRVYVEGDEPDIYYIPP